MTRYNKLESERVRNRRYEKEGRSADRNEAKWSRALSKEFGTSKLTGKQRKGYGPNTLPSRE